MFDSIGSTTRRNFVRLCAGAAASSAQWMRAATASSMPGGSADDAAPSDVEFPRRGAVSAEWTEDWENGMVSGNGCMGVLTYGAPEAPVFLLNHNRLYTAAHDPAGIGPANTARFVPEIRRLIREQGYTAAMDFAYQKAKENGLAPNESNDFHPGLVLRCRIAKAGEAKDYRRWENFETAEIQSSWQGTAGAFRTRAFASRADRIVVLSIERRAGQPLDCDLEIEVAAGKPVRFEPRHGSNWIGTHCLYAPGNGGYDCVLRVAAEGGIVKLEDGKARVGGVHKLTILARIERYRPPRNGSIDAIASALDAIEPQYERLLDRHAKIHSAFFHRVRLDLGGTNRSDATTDELLERAAKEKTLSPALLEKIYDACRYVVLCSSGDLPPNLQGVWSGAWNPPWHGDYSADANLQLAVDSTCSGNMPELMEGFFSLIEAGMPSWREGARKLAGCRGILYPARMQDQGTYFQQSHDWPWFNQIPIAGWLGHYFYDYYRYTGDRAFLKNRAIPYLKECALFYEDWYVTDPDGHLRATPSFSYECASCDNATIEFAVVREVLTNLIESCELLGVEANSIGRWKALLAKVPPYMVNTSATTGGQPPHYWSMEDSGVLPAADGTLKEFIEPNMLEYPSHRHLSLLYPLFVSYEFSPEGTPELWQAALGTYLRKIASFKESDSHNRMISSLCAARLGRGDDAWGFLTAMAVNGVFHSSLVPSHYDHRKVFNVDASGGIPSVLHSCLVFSLPGRLDLLPAIPSALARGSIEGIRARGEIVLDRLAWDCGAGTIELHLTSANRQELALGLPNGAISGAVSMNGRTHMPEKTKAGRLVCNLNIARGPSEVHLRFNRA